jgi:glutamate 5-kinase
VNLAESGAAGPAAVSTGAVETGPDSPVPPTAVAFARGVAAFSEDEIPRIAGKTTDELRLLYPDRRHLEVVHRDNLVLL